MTFRARTRPGAGSAPPTAPSRVVAAGDAGDGHPTRRVRRDDSVGLPVDRRLTIARPALQMPGVAAGLHQVADPGHGAPPLGQGRAQSERDALFLDPPELDQLGAQLVGQPGRGGVGADHDQRVTPREGVGQPRPTSGLFGLLDGSGVDEAPVFGVLAHDGGVPVAQPQRGAAFPGLVEAADLGQLVLDPPLGDVGQRTARADGGELLLVADQQQLSPPPPHTVRQIATRSGVDAAPASSTTTRSPRRSRNASSSPLAAARDEAGLPVEPAADVAGSHPFLGQHVGLALPVGQRRTPAGRGPLPDPRAPPRCHQEAGGRSGARCRPERRPGTTSPSRPGRSTPPPPHRRSGSLATRWPGPA